MDTEKLRFNLELRLKEISLPYLNKLGYGLIQGPFYSDLLNNGFKFCFNFDDMFGSTSVASIHYMPINSQFEWFYDTSLNNIEKGSSHEEEEPIIKIQERIISIPEYRKERFVQIFEKYESKKHNSAEDGLVYLEKKLIATPEELEFVKEKVINFYKIRQ